MPTTGDDDIDLTEYADEQGSTGSGSETYLLIELEGSNEVKSGYIRLGGVDPAVKTKFQALASGGSVTWTDDEKVKGEDLAAEVTTFIDDSRIRGPADEGGSTAAADNTFRTLTQSQRKSETATLHTKGGWRDHTQGNRITTTRGDKIEVIRGNYKQRVLGRSQWEHDAGSGLHWESSGGITYHFDEVPGQIVDVRWSDQDGTWKVFEECDNGHQVDRYHGVKKEWSRGGDVVDRVGSQAAYDSDDDTPRAFWSGSVDPGFESDSDFDKPDDASHNADFSWPSDNALPSLSEEVYAQSVVTKVRCNDYKSQMGDFTRWVNKIEEKSHITTWREEHHYESFFNGSFSFGVAAELWQSVFREVFDGEGISLKTALAFCDVRAGGAAEVDIVAAKLDVKMSKNVWDLEAMVSWGDYGLGLINCVYQSCPGKVSANAVTTRTAGFKASFARFLFLG